MTDRPKPERPAEDLAVIREFCRLVDARRAGDGRAAAQARRELMKLGWPISIQAGQRWRVSP